MAMTMKMEGLEELEKMLSEVAENAEAIASLALYDGAGVMADAVNASVDGILVAPFHYAATESTTRLPSPEEKELLKQGAAGIAKFKKDGFGAETSVGYKDSGYGMINGKKKPIPLIANSINSGTSFMRKQPFFRNAVNRAKAKAEAAIEKKAEQLFDEIGNKYN